METEPELSVKLCLWTDSNTTLLLSPLSLYNDNVHLSIKTIKRAKEHAYVASHVHENIHVSRKVSVGCSKSGWLQLLINTHWQWKRYG